MGENKHFDGLVMFVKICWDCGAKNKEKQREELSEVKGVSNGKGGILVPSDSR